VQTEIAGKAMNGNANEGHSANGAGPEATETGWRAEQQLIRLLTKTQRRRERLAQGRGGLEAAKADDEAAWAALDQERSLSDAEDRRFGSLLWAFAITIVVSLVDVLPAYWAAQALGNGVTDTWLVTGILVAGLTGFAWMMSHHRNRGGRWQLLVALGFTAGLILVEAVLRVRYMLVVNDATGLDAALQGLVMACVSGVLVWVGYIKLVDAEPYATWKRRRAAQRTSADLKKLHADYERADSEYRQALQALRQAWYECESRNPRLVAAIEDELRLSPPPEAPHYQSGMDSFLGATRALRSAAAPDTEGATL
jgi:hypothetical protein